MFRAALGGDFRGPAGLGGFRRLLLASLPPPPPPLPRLTDTKSVLKKIAADQIVFAPFTVCFYLPMTVLFQEFSEKKLDSSKPLGHKILDTVTTKGPPILMIDWMVWPVASFINFKYIPHKSQQLYYAVLSSLWTCFLSFMSWNEITEDEK